MPKYIITMENLKMKHNGVWKSTGDVIDVRNGATVVSKVQQGMLTPFAEHLETLSVEAQEAVAKAEKAATVAADQADKAQEAAKAEAERLSAAAASEKKAAAAAKKKPPVKKED